jgi:hydroxymethylbilane synthase
MKKIIRVGTRESQLAVWQADQVKSLLHQSGYEAELVFIKSEGDIDLNTPLYEMGVQGIFTRSLDMALLNDRIDLAVHSMKDVPTQLPVGIKQAAVLKRASYKDLLVENGQWSVTDRETIRQGHPFSNHTGQLPNVIGTSLTIATSSIRRKAQWLHRYPNDIIENLRGNVNTRLKKLNASDWNGAIFAAAGLERIGLRPENSIELDWMLPAPAQGAIVVVCRENDDDTFFSCTGFNDDPTALCAKIERDFLRALSGGCSTPISALAEVKDDQVFFKGNILSVDGQQKAEIERRAECDTCGYLGKEAADELLMKGGKSIAEDIKNAAK